MMKPNVLQIVFVLALWAGAVPSHAQSAAQAAAPAGAAVTAEAPDALVMKVSKSVIGSVRTDKSLQSGDLSKLQKLVDEQILPYVNFEKMTRLAVGRGWRQATPEQRERLTQEFRTLLVRTYAGAIAQASEHEVKLLPFRPQNEKDVVVRTQVVAPRGEPIQLDYRMEKTDAGWKIYDVNILGVWLVQNYQNSFASEINQGGVDGLIKSMVERNKQAATAKKP
jgi:phospholipid transport system substrate-binding protein